MADSGQRTEKPTQRRLENARKEGNYPASKEFITAVHFMGVVAIVTSFSGAFLFRLMRLMRYLLSLAFTTTLSMQQVVALARSTIAPDLLPLIFAGFGLTVLIVAIQMGTTGGGISFSKLAPDLKRLNPLSKITGLPGQNIPIFLQALLLLPLVGAVLYFELTENINSFMQLPWLDPRSAIARVGGTVETLLWRAAGLFLLVGICDLFWQRHRYTKQLKMSKQEVREEHKDQEGNPHMKARVRRIQRDMARRHMMKEVPTATAIIVNPTHYAVAIRYVIPSAPGEVPSAPRVVAKGKNYLAGRIRKLAMENQVPIVENPPLARALYKSVDVGQEIPADLYRAVAEILAYIYRLMNGRLPGG
ncbi:MAG: EscU/YscU/HrcU family type III secretion system export apparatus switch protein [Acidobacteriota bacterium]